MKKSIIILSVFLFVFAGTSLAQTTKYYINSLGQVAQTTGEIPSGSFYLDASGHIRAIDGDGGVYVVKGNTVVSVPTEASSTVGNENKSESSEGDNGNKYYIDENKKLQTLNPDSDPGKSYYTNEYGKLLESKGKKKQNNSTN